MYKINPSVYSSVFVLPKKIVDEHLKMAGAAQLKMILWLFRHSNETVDSVMLAQAIGLQKADVEDAMNYWIEKGIVTREDESIVQVQRDDSKKAEIKIIEKPKAEQKKEVLEKEEVKPPFVKPTHGQIAVRLNESEELKELFNEVQQILGRTIGYDGQANLLYLHDYYGLPVDVIICLCGYAKTIGKHTAMNYIVKTGASWAKEDIVTFEKASEKILRLESAERIWNELKVLMGVANPKPTPTQAKYLEIWVSDYQFSTEMIFCAYEKMAEQTGKLNFKYMHKILESWFNENYKTTSDVQAAEDRFRLEKEKTVNTPKKKITKKTVPQSAQASYDLDKAVQSKFDFDPTKTKRRA